MEETAEDNAEPAGSTFAEGTREMRVHSCIMYPTIRAGLNTEHLATQSGTRIYRGTQIGRRCESP